MMKDCSTAQSTESDLYPRVQMLESILKGLHNEVGHWDFNSTYSFVWDLFWWLNMQQEMASSLKSYDTCQKTKPGNRKEFECKIPISGLSHKSCIDFAGRQTQTNVYNQYLIVAIEKISK